MPSRRRVLAVGGAVAVVLLAAGAAAAAATTSGQVPRGVSVGDVELGGLRADEAEQRIAAAFPPGEPSPVVLLADGEELAVDAAAAGLAVDAAATARTAADAGPLDRLRAVFSAPRQVEPALEVDSSALQAELRRVAEPFARPPREGSVAFDEELEPVATMPLAGRELDLEQVREALLGAWPLETRVEVPVEVVEVRTTEEDVERAVRELAPRVVGDPVVLTSEGGDLPVPPDVLGAATRLELDDGELAPVVDGAVVLERTAEARRRLEEPAVDATFDTSSGTPVVVPSRTGRGFGAEDTAEAVRSVVTAEAPRRARVEFSTTQPRVTTEVAEGLGVVEQVSSYTSRFPCCAPRVQNIRRIAEIVDGHVVLPGESFDLNAVVGPRDTARGFVPAPQILEGEFVDAVGGGVSQFATALFNAYFFAGLEDVTHTPHSYYISRYPPGREATVSFPLPDLVFRNDSPHGILIRTSSTGTSVTVSMWGTKRFDVRAVQGPRTRVTTAPTRYITRPGCQPGNGGEGFDIVVTRVFSQDGREVRREPFRTRYLPQPKFVCGPPPSRTPAPAPPPAEEPAPPVPPEEPAAG
ncbi:MAG TPA: VanW family protein [Mycobacteriales bacterium]|nr:VanW family protein [Mycobacteriales bacterium]